MKKSKFSSTQIALILKEFDGGKTVDELERFILEYKESLLKYLDSQSSHFNN
jgi:hypothetical protein